MRIGIVAGEASGDILGAGLMRALREIYPNAEFSGIGGTRMLAEGMVSFYALDRLSVMGLVDPLKRLPELLRMRSNLVRHFQIEPPDVFIGIDAPDFTLGIEAKLRRIGIKTVHYVSPSVWAWRQGRVKKIARAVDLMLTLFPFEAAFYREHAVPVEFVGHPLADQYPLEPDVDGAREDLACTVDGRVIAVLPGSRGGEIKLLGPLFLSAAQDILRQDPTCQVLIPAANDDRYAQLQGLISELGMAPDVAARMRLLHGQSQQAMTAADVVLMTSGTTTLEAMLLKKPMVVAYRLPPVSYWLISRLVKTPYIALPNLLAGEALVPELLQDAATPAALTAALSQWLDEPVRVIALQARFAEIHGQLRRGASDVAAQAIVDMLEAN